MAVDPVIPFAPRKRYANDYTDTAEKQIVEAVIGAWRLEPRYEKCPYWYSIDFAVFRNGKIAGFVEAKTRENYRYGFSNMHGGYCVGAYRLTHAQRFAKTVGLPLYLAIRFAGPAIYIARVHKFDFTKMETAWFGPNVPRDGEDAEPSIVIPWPMLFPLKERTSPPIS